MGGAKNFSEGDGLLLFIVAIAFPFPCAGNKKDSLIFLTFDYKFHMLITANGYNINKVIIVKLYFNVKRNFNHCEEHIEILS